VKDLAWDENKRWYLRSTFLTIGGRVVRSLGIMFFWITCFLAFAYYPYHLQIRRIATVTKSSVSASSLLETGTTECTDSTLTAIRNHYKRISIGDNLGFAPYDSRDEEDYEKAATDLKNDPLSILNVWENLQFWSRLLAIGEWFLLAMQIIYSLAFLNFVVMGSIILVTGRNSERIKDDSVGDSDGNFTAKYEFWSQVVFSFVGLWSVILVVTHGIVGYRMQYDQLKITESANIVCGTGMHTCFGSNEMFLCDWLNSDDSGLSGTASTVLCNEAFTVESCHIFGQDEVPTKDVIAFGQYKFGGYDCTDYHCPASDTRDTMVKMASKKFWQTLQEGPELSLGVSEYSFDSTQGLIISMHVFGALFVICTLIDFGLLLYSVIVISVDEEWPTITSDFEALSKMVKGGNLQRHLRVYDRSRSV